MASTVHRVGLIRSGLRGCIAAAKATVISCWDEEKQQRPRMDRPAP
jgi:hypothetical protein